jgi:hypothetical protein
VPAIVRQPIERFLTAQAKYQLANNTSHAHNYLGFAQLAVATKEAALAAAELLSHEVSPLPQQQQEASDSSDAGDSKVGEGATAGASNLRGYAWPTTCLVYSFCPHANVNT